MVQSANVQSPARVPLSRPDLGEEEIQAVVEVLRSGWITGGPRVHAFEEQFASYVSRAHALAVQSCTSALFMALQALDLPPGSEVIIPAMTWPSAVSGCLYLGLVPVMADVEWSSLNLSRTSFTQKLTPRTRAVVPVHFAGLPYDVDGVAAVAANHGLAIIDDAAHATGSRYRGEPVGKHALAACYSFHPIKNMTTGEGGMIATDDDTFAAKLLPLRLLGVDRDAWKRYGTRQSSAYDITTLSLKHNMTDIQAALGLVQLRRVDELNAQRRVLAERYQDALSGTPGLILPDAGDANHTHSWHLFGVRTEAEQGAFSRDAIMQKLADDNVSTGVHFIAIPDLTYFRNRLELDPSQTPIATRAGRTIMSLPLFPGMTEDQQTTVIEAVKRAFGS
jgi:UDP-4-amino-4-deoxy-L-arabinose-oxoglutarate aminotransferase